MLISPTVSSFSIVVAHHVGPWSCTAGDGYMFVVLQGLRVEDGEMEQDEWNLHVIPVPNPVQADV